MDVAKHLSAWREQSPEQWLGTANRFLPPVVTSILVVGIAYQLSALTWALTGATDVSAVATPTTPVAPRSVTKASSDFGSLSDSHLFGEAPKGTAAVVLPAVTDAPDTTLALTLSGILFLEGDTGGQAIISANKGPERSYQVGQAVDNANGATVHTVLADRVLLNRGDHLEALRLPKEPSAAAPSRTSFAPPAAPAANDSLRQVITQNASRLTDIFRIAPAIDQGKVIGFRVNPGRDKDTFDALGLHAGDVISDINGTTLDDPSRGLQVFESLGEATQANVTVVRDGAPQVLVIDTSQLQKLKENRE